MIRKSISTYNTASHLTFITTDGSLQYVHCAAYTRDISESQPTLIQAPLDWCKPYDNETGLKRWEYHINLLGGVVEFQGTGTFTGKPVPTVNKWLLKTYAANPLLGIEDFISSDLWTKWKIPAETPVTKRYYTLCLIRYIQSKHLSPIIDRYYDIIEKLTDIEPFNALQMAHYAHEQGSKGSPYYNTTWTVFDNLVRNLGKPKDLSALNDPFGSSLHGKWRFPLYRGNGDALKELIIKGDYKTAYNKLNG